MGKEILKHIYNISPVISHKLKFMQVHFDLEEL